MQHDFTVIIIPHPFELKLPFDCLQRQTRSGWISTTPQGGRNGAIRSSRPCNLHIDVVRHGGGGSGRRSEWGGRPMVGGVHFERPRGGDKEILAGRDPA